MRGKLLRILPAIQAERLDTSKKNVHTINVRTRLRVTDENWNEYQTRMAMFCISTKALLLKYMHEHNLADVSTAHLRFVYADDPESTPCENEQCCADGACDEIIYTFVARRK